MGINYRFWMRISVWYIYPVKLYCLLGILEFWNLRLPCRPFFGSGVGFGDSNYLLYFVDGLCGLDV